MYYMIDNYDSFVYNLSAYMQENGQDIIVRRADEVSLSEIYEINPEGILISPGPGRPQDALVSKEILSAFQEQVPILGICLGHQLIGHFYGAQTCKGPRPMHGKISRITHDHSSLFAGLPDSFSVTRYHSLIVSEHQLPPSLRVTARSQEGIVMGLQHCTLPVYGVQFHPEAVLTEYGHELLLNFHHICQEWKLSHPADCRVSDHPGIVRASLQEVI